MKFHIWFHIFIYLILLLYSSCDRPIPPDDCFDYDFSDCNTIRPDEGEIILRFSINKHIPAVAFTVFKGKTDLKDTILSDTLNIELIRYSLPVDQYYSVSADYMVDGKKIRAIAGGEIKLKKYLVCDSICYVVSNPVINLKLRRDIVK